MQTVARLLLNFLGAGISERLNLEGTGTILLRANDSTVNISNPLFALKVSVIG